MRVCVCASVCASVYQPKTTCDEYVGSLFVVLISFVLTSSNRPGNMSSFCFGAGGGGGIPAWSQNQVIKGAGK